MQDFSHEAFVVSGYNYTISSPQEAQTVIKAAWDEMMKQGKIGNIEHKLSGSVHAVYYNYKNLDDRSKLGYDMLIGFMTEPGTQQTDPNIITLTIPAQDYKYMEVSGDFAAILGQKWAEINAMPKEEVNRDFGYDLEMYSEDYKSATLAVSVVKH